MTSSEIPLGKYGASTNEDRDVSVFIKSVNINKP